MNNIHLDVMENTAKAIAANPELKMRKWAANVQWKNGVQNEVKIRDFAPFFMDEPDTLGGTNIAANPVEVLIGAAASCFAITFEVMASQKGIKLENVDVQIEADLNAAVFLGLEEGEGGILNPVIRLKAVTSASKEQIEEVARVAITKSPVVLSLNTDINLIVE
ncbi:OsmC family protein [Rubeoparvulum massiliense]|uniref:OsmC family protein n=1 Tax=Rubeoparvulum massiliense TaxID=1631346 RepID=UPI00065DDBD4|nr:OsmC family protein [Rubeoparvulum massiliense]